MRYKIGSIYFIILGMIISILGVTYIALAFTGIDISTNYLVVKGSLWSTWKGIILVFSGIFISIGGSDLKNIHGLGKALLGSITLWIVTGANLFGRITASIPGEESWFSSLEGFLSSYGPPFEPVLWVFPFSLAILYFVTRAGEQN